MLVNVETSRKNSWNNLVKTVVVPHGEVLTGFEHNFIAPKGKISAVDTWILGIFKVAASINDNRKSP